MAPLTVVAYYLDAVVPRKARSCLPRAVPMAWWSYRVPVLPPAAENSAEETRKTCSPQRVCVAPASNLAAPVTSKKPPKRARRCLNCDAVDTPQWRSGPMGKSTLCNACGVRYRAVGTLLDHRPATRTMLEPWPETPESPHSPIWKPAKVGRPPKQKLASPPSLAPVPPRKTKLWKKKRTKSCVHCGSSETPQWREGPMGRGTLCNACGVRYRQGRLLPEYRSKWSPTFSASEHASNHHRQPRENNQSPPVSDLAAPATSKKPPKRARRCLNCDAVDTPQWRSGPMGKSTLCNACGVRYRAVGTLLDHRPATRTMAEPWPETPESPHCPIWNWKPAKLGRPPKQKLASPPSPAPVPPRKTKLRKKKRMKSCVHCGSSETPQWREGPMGRGTLCNACGLRFSQGRLLPEYRPKGSPTFSASEHATNHCRVLQLRRHQRENNQSPPPTPTPTVDSATAKPIVDEQPMDPQQEQPIDFPQEQPIDEPVTAAGDMPNSLDALLLDGPSAPLIMDGDDFLIS
ncbi:hypothetical protein GUJ93_ZPchr0009g1898 [Zizania palustris]|uniref:GATA-type domain-containing protein n=1 Tax=Zizania palustris TaxID=103762 RepID=A0A8J5V8C1_ZIZPA|nr:hypothetical protein GUJ93_ZPchr0009g1898 [Zizania palustris]